MCSQYQLKMRCFNGMSRQISEGLYSEVQKVATRVRKRHDGPVNVIEPRKEWELEDPGTRMIGDWDGYLRIEKVRTHQTEED